MRALHLRARHGGASSPALVAGAIAVCVYVAWRNRITLDDAYISFTYAKHLVEGKGLVWTTAVPPVEGYTNFLWTLIAAIPLWCGWEIELSMHLFGMVLFAASLASLYVLALRVTGDAIAALGATVATGLFFTFSSYATSGLETQLQTLLLLLATLACRRLADALPRSPGEGQGGGAPARSSPWRTAIVLGVVTLLATLTRLDSAIAIAPLFAVAASARLGSERSARALLPFALAAAMAVAGLAPWLLWKLSFYGSILPNSFRAKVVPEISWPEGYRYLSAFVRSYLFAVPLLGAAAALATARRDGRVADTALLALPALAWILYVTRVGGDFMEFRLLVPILPLVMILGFAGVRACIETRWAIALAVLLVLAGSEHHRRLYRWREYQGPVDLTALTTHTRAADGDWPVLGRYLGTAFAGGAVQPTIALTSVGAIVFYADLPAVDMLGLNEADVEEFKPLSSIAGHRRLISVDRLRRRGANFLIGHPLVKIRSPAMGERPFTYAQFSESPYFRYSEEDRLRGHKVIEMPLANDQVLLMLYLTEDPAIDTRLRQLGWRVYPAL